VPGKKGPIELSTDHVVHMPSVREIARKSGFTLMMSSFIPMGIFYTSYSLSGIKMAVGLTIGWYYAGLLFRFLRGKPVIGAVMLGAGLLTVRAVVTFWTGSAFLYFLQPVAGTIATATAISLTAMTGRPLLDRLAHDFCPLPEGLSTQLRENSFFRHISLVWTTTYLINAAGTVWLLTNSSLGGFLLLKSVLSPCLTGCTVVISILMFKRVMRRDNVTIRWGAAKRLADIEVPVPLAVGV
jgi:uncharacterized membrane protein